MRHDSVKAGDVFGRLTVSGVSYSAKRKDGTAGERVMLCVCACGERVTVRTSNLKSGNTKSCGCLQSERAAAANRARQGADHEN